MAKLAIAVNTEIKIDRGVLPPAPAARRAKYPWREMEVGDSFAVPDDVNADNFRRSAVAASVATQKKFSVRKLPDGSYRCWRIA